MKRKGLIKHSPFDVDKADKVIILIDPETGDSALLTPPGMSMTKIIGYLSSAIHAAREQGHLNSQIPKDTLPN